MCDVKRLDRLKKPGGPALDGGKKLRNSTPRRVQMMVENRQNNTGLVSPAPVMRRNGNEIGILEAVVQVSGFTRGDKTATMPAVKATKRKFKLNLNTSTTMDPCSLT